MFNFRFHKYIKSLLLLVTVTLWGCATSKNPNDPYEDYNRKIFSFNMAMDHYVLRPVTVGYVNYIPQPIRYVVSNFYNNLRDFVSLGNDVLQLDGMDSMQTTMRIGLNSTFGLLGMIDIASSMGLQQHKNTFGNTMKRWGWINSHYFLVPFLGPGTVRDQFGVVPDVWFDPTWYVINNYWVSGSLFVVNQIDSRSKFLGQDQLLAQALDPYGAIRDIYLQSHGEYVYSSINKENSDDNDLDSLIADENARQPKVEQKTDVYVISSNIITSSNLGESQPATISSTSESTQIDNQNQLNSTFRKSADTPFIPLKTNLQTFDGKTVYSN